MSESRTATTGVTRIGAGGAVESDDVVAVEEPLEIRLAYAGAVGELREKPLSVTMRTPGDDFDLAVGFLFTEGIITSGNDVESVRHWSSPNVVRIELRRGIRVDTQRLERHFYTTSSCGVCGKTSIDAVRVATEPIAIGEERVAAATIHALPDLLRARQAAFDATGAIHAAGIFDLDGTLLCLREDVGRHNAVDKAIGSFVREDAELLRRVVLLVSGRASFELVQKAAVARIPILAAVGAPSSLACELARTFNLTLLGFVRDTRFNIYSAPERIVT